MWFLCMYIEIIVFQVWDLSSATLVYQSTIISSSPFISMTMNPLHESFALGTTDGQVRDLMNINPTN